MKILKTPWKDDFMLLAKQAEKSIRITSPYVKQNICYELLKTKRESTKIQLITSFRLLSMHSGGLDLAAIEAIIHSKGIVKSIQRLHSKIYIFDDTKAIVTSGNMSSGGLVNNYEYGLFLDEKEIVKNIIEDFNELLDGVKTVDVEQKNVDEVKDILKNIPKPDKVELPDYTIKSPDEDEDSIDILLPSIRKSLKGWDLHVFDVIYKIDKAVFELEDVYAYRSEFSKLHPSNNTIKDSIRQKLQHLRELGLLDFLGGGKYRKLWK